jgi:hypothetical protein
MQVHDESRNVTSICHLRPSSLGSSKVTHSRAAPGMHILSVVVVCRDRRS